jgi:hypothetical protein
MKKVALLVGLLVLISCENDIRVNMDDKPVPVTYCILDTEDSVQFVRLARSFIPEAGYSDLDHLELQHWNEPVEIYLEEWAGQDQPVIYDFHRTDTIRQDTGYFANPSFDLYRASMKPLPGVEYYLYLWFPERQYYSYASTLAVGNPVVLNPAAIPGRKVTFSEMDDFIVEFRPPQNSGFHQFSFILTLEEHIGTGFNLDYFRFGAQTYEDNNGEVILSLLNSNRFYANLLQRYDTLRGNDYRRITGLEFVLYSYGKELRLYNQLYNNGSQPWEIQSYSSFRNGFGLFSSISHTRVTNLELSDLTYQTLAGDSRYKHMKLVR